MSKCFIKKFTMKPLGISADFLIFGAIANDHANVLLLEEPRFWGGGFFIPKGFIENPRAKV